MGGNRAELSNLEGDGISWDSLLKKYRGNVLYIDFWASWCVPCRRAIPSSLKMRKQFQGKKLIFLYLSLDKNPLSWKKAVEEEGIPKDMSYIIPDSDKSMIVKKFNVRGIPRYLIIGRDGSVYESNAPSPLEMETQKTLNGYLGID